MRVFRQIRAVARVELLRLARDRTSLSLIITVPILQILLFGAAINLNPSGISIGIAGGGPSAQESAVEIVQNTGYFGRVIAGLSADEAVQSLKNGNIQVAIEFADDAEIFDNLEAQASAFGDERGSEPKLYVDGADPAAVAPAVAALQAAALGRQIAILTDLTDGHARSGEVIWLHNPDRNSRWVSLPPLIGVIVMISSLMLGALSVVREKELGSWATLIASPLPRHQIIWGKMTPYISIAAFQIVVAYCAAVWVFDVPALGSHSALFFAGIMTAIVYLQLGFIVSLLAGSQLHALQAAVALYLPSLLLSGFMFPFSAMPYWAQLLGEAMPLKHFVSIARDTMLRGGAFIDNGGGLLVLVLMSILGWLAIIASSKRATP